ncbi:MAG: hypothetical protein FWH27_18855 [Planctomycetaceae bacterium]|nr:hypothetical protein [Planctomycetaceae bacterium]
MDIHEELKDLTNAESSRIIGERAREIAEQYHIEMIAESPRKTCSRLLNRA